MLLESDVERCRGTSYLREVSLYFDGLSGSRDQGEVVGGRWCR